MTEEAAAASAAAALPAKSRTAVVYVSPPIAPSPFNPQNPNFKPRVAHPDSKFNIKYPSNPVPHGSHRFATSRTWTRKVGAAEQMPTQDPHTTAPSYTTYHRHKPPSNPGEDYSRSHVDHPNDFSGYDKNDVRNDCNPHHNMIDGSSGMTHGQQASRQLSADAHGRSRDYDGAVSFVAMRQASVHTPAGRADLTHNHNSHLDTSPLIAPISQNAAFGNSGSPSPRGDYPRSKPAISLSAGSDARSSSLGGDGGVGDGSSSYSSGQNTRPGAASGHSNGGKAGSEQLSPTHVQETPFKTGFKLGKATLRANSHREAKVFAGRVAAFEGNYHEEAMEGFSMALDTDPATPGDEATAAQQAQFLAIASGQLPESGLQMTAAIPSRRPRQTVVMRHSGRNDGNEGEIGALGSNGWEGNEGDLSVRQSGRRHVAYGGSGSRHYSSSGSDGYGHTQQLSKRQRKQQRQQQQHQARGDQQQQQQHIVRLQDGHPGRWQHDDPCDRPIRVRKPQQQQQQPFEHLPQQSSRAGQQSSRAGQQSSRVGQQQPFEYLQQQGARGPQFTRVVTALAPFEFELADESDLSDRPYRNHRVTQAHPAQHRHQSNFDPRQLAAHGSRKDGHKGHSRAAGHSRGSESRQRSHSLSTVPHQARGDHQARGEQSCQLQPKPVTADQKLGMTLDAIGKKLKAVQPEIATSAQPKKRSQDDMSPLSGRRQPGGGGGAPGHVPNRVKTAGRDGSQQPGRLPASLSGRQQGRNAGSKAASQENKKLGGRKRGGVKHCSNGNTDNSNGGGGIVRSVAPAGVSNVPTGLSSALGQSKGGGSGSAVWGSSVSAAGLQLQPSGKHTPIQFSLGQMK